MKLPRDITGCGLAKALTELGYNITRQTSSHLRLTTLQNGEQHISIPAHTPLKVGTLAAYSLISNRTINLPVMSF
jgi:predicted RNA binding protein YcfA (HicA-like mRNA interferase family)